MEICILAISVGLQGSSQNQKPSEQKKGPHRPSKSCILAHLNELTDAVNKKALPLDAEKGIISDVRTGGRFCGKASTMSKKSASI